MEIPQDMLHTSPTCRICDVIASRATDEQRRAFAAAIDAPTPDGERLCTCSAQMVPHRPVKGVCPSTP